MQLGSAGSPTLRLAGVKVKAQAFLLRWLFQETVRCRFAPLFATVFVPDLNRDVGAPATDPRLRRGASVTKKIDLTVEKIVK